jgi:hypothetical protein
MAGAVMARKNRPPLPKPRINRTVPRYVPQSERKENRARYWRFAYWAAVALPLVFVAMAIGYSDQVPLGVRAATEQLDAAFGYPVLRLIALIAGR